MPRNPLRAAQGKKAKKKCSRDQCHRLSERGCHMPSSKGEGIATKGRCMKRSVSKAKSRAQLLQKRLILLKRRNHWQIVLDHLMAAAEEDRIGDPAEPTRQLGDLHRQLAALDRVLRIRSRNEQTKSRMVRRSLMIAGRKTNVSLE